jgi:hypothetical protein
MKKSYGEPFSEYVIIPINGWYKENVNRTKSHLLATEVDIQINMFSSSMMHWICGEIDITHIVIVNDSSGLHRTLQFLQQLTNPTRLSDGEGNNSIFSLIADVGDGGLTPRRPCY